MYKNDLLIPFLRVLKHPHMGHRSINDASMYTARGMRSSLTSSWFGAIRNAVKFNAEMLNDHMELGWP